MNNFGFLFLTPTSKQLFLTQPSTYSILVAKGMLKKRLPRDQMVSGYLEGLFDVIWEHVIIFYGSQSFVGGKGPFLGLFLSSHFKHAAENLKYVVPVIVTIDFVLLNI